MLLKTHTLLKLWCFIKTLLGLCFLVLLLLRRSKCHKIGYASTQSKKSAKDSEDRGTNLSLLLGLTSEFLKLELNKSLGKCFPHVVESSPDEYDPRRWSSSRKRSPASSFKTPAGGKGSAKDTKRTYSKSKKRAKPQGPRAVEVIHSDDDDSDYDSSLERNVTELPEKVRSLFFPLPLSM